MPRKNKRKTKTPKTKEDGSEKTKRPRRSVKINILGKEARRNWHCIVNIELESRGKPKNKDGKFYTYSFARALSSFPKVTDKIFKDWVKKYKKEHSPLQFIQLLVKAKLHEDGDSDENKRLFIRSLIEEYGESETTTPAQPEQPGGEELPVDKKIEARFGRMIMGHLLVPYLKAIKQLNTSLG